MCQKWGDPQHVGFVGFSLNKREKALKKHTRHFLDSLPALLVDPAEQGVQRREGDLQAIQARFKNGQVPFAAKRENR